MDNEMTPVTLEELKTSEMDAETIKRLKADIAKVAMLKPAPDKMAWRRKRIRIDKMAQQATEILNNIAELQVKADKLVVDLEETHKAMVGECIHPSDMLVHHGSYIHCKFCDRKIVLQNKDL